MTENNEYPIRAVLKAGNGYDAPWLTVAGDTAADVALKLKAVIDQELPTVVAHAARQLAGVWTVADVLGGGPVEPAAQQSGQPYSGLGGSVPGGSMPQAQQQYQPAQQQQAAPGGQPAPQCRHGARTLKSGTSKAGKDYSGWMCSSRDRQDQCEPIWNRG